MANNQLIIKRTSAGTHDEIFVKGEILWGDFENITLEDATEMFNDGIGIISYDAQMVIRGKV